MTAAKIEVKVLKAFSFSPVGHGPSRRAEVGQTLSDIPADLIPGLAKEGYVRVLSQTKATLPPENKAYVGGSEENKSESVETGGGGEGGTSDTAGWDSGEEPEGWQGWPGHKIKGLALKLTGDHPSSVKVARRAIEEHYAKVKAEKEAAGANAETGGGAGDGEGGENSEF